MKPKWRNILIVLGLFVAVVLLIDFNRRMEELNRLTTKLEAVRAEGTTVMQTQAALVTQVAYATSDAGSGSNGRMRINGCGWVSIRWNWFRPGASRRLLNRRQ